MWPRPLSFPFGGAEGQGTDGYTTHHARAVGVALRPPPAGPGAEGQTVPAGVSRAGVGVWFYRGRALPDTGGDGRNDPAGRAVPPGDDLRLGSHRDFSRV